MTSHKLLLRPCTVADIPSLAILHNTCFAGPRNELVYGNVTIEEKLKHYEDGLRVYFDNHSTDSHPEAYHVVCIVDPTLDNTIISYAIWVQFPNGYLPSSDPQTQHSYLPSGANEALILETERKAAEIRSEHPARFQPHWHLPTLCTHPDHEGRGAASMLINWGLKRADETGMVKCFVESTPRGLDVYKKRGFTQEVGVLEMDMSGHEGGEKVGVARWVALMREPTRN
ncbi:MAG: hypothetical protein LQ350_006914 [Teloschistes chrysophthalmus]|nr:MAG: hypothetical protein LQ350_006914 [Niorma chrysophthalma]